MKFGPVVQEEMLLKEKVYGHTTDGRKTDGRIMNKEDHKSSP